MVFLSLRATFTPADMKQDRARKCADQEVMERQTEKWYGTVLFMGRKTGKPGLSNTSIKILYNY
jgi:hypothetical protein